VKFRRKKTESTESTEPAGRPGTAAEACPAPSTAEAGLAPRPAGPWDASEVDLEQADPQRVDLGGLQVESRPGLELRLQVDEKSQQVAAVLLVGSEGALELRPFAAPRNGGIWDDVRRKIAAETARRGGTATEKEGEFGTELHVAMPAKTAEGQPGTQPSRVLGIEGPRWLLRATLLGRPALEPDPGHELEQALRDVVVVRGSAPMAPGDPLPLVMPANARPAGGDAS
jgi:hypothetical protein